MTPKEIPQPPAVIGWVLPLIKQFGLPLIMLAAVTFFFYKKSEEAEVRFVKQYEDMQIEVRQLRSDQSDMKMQIRQLQTDNDALKLENSLLKSKI